MIVVDFEALRPFVFGFVLEFELEGFVGEIGEFGLCGDVGVANATSLGDGQFLV